MISFICHYCHKIIPDTADFPKIAIFHQKVDGSLFIYHKECWVKTNED